MDQDGLNYSFIPVNADNHNRFLAADVMQGHILTEGDRLTINTWKDECTFKKGKITLFYRNKQINMKNIQKRVDKFNILPGGMKRKRV